MPPPSPTQGEPEPSVWEVLEVLEANLIETFHATSDALLPHIVHSSNLLYSHLEALFRQVYQKSIEIGLDPSSIIAPPWKEPLNVPPSRPTDRLPAILGGGPDRPFYRRLLKPRYILIATGVFFSSRFALNFLLSTSQVQSFLRSRPALWRALPKSVKARIKRSTKITRPRYSVGGQTRLEAIIVLGADPGSVGYHLSLHLSSIGFIVIASVSRLEFVGQIEREGLGWVKALVLDLGAGQTTAFNRSLAACLSLRFPLNSPGDAFVSACNQSLLVGMVNCLPLSFSYELRPVENLDVSQGLLDGISKLAGVSLDVVKVVLPMMRISVEKNGAEDGVILTLFPTKTTTTALPYISSSLIANQTLENLMLSLRRELIISNSDSRDSIRIINERIGLYRSTTHFSSHFDPQDPTPSLPPHLHPIYAPSLSRRVAFLNLPTTHLPIFSHNGSPLPQLIQRIQKIVQSPNITSGSCVATGREAWKYKLISTLVPTSLLECWLGVVERLNGWVRQKVVGEVNLESAENLERVIPKRNLSSRSNWKADFFTGRSRTVQEESAQSGEEGLAESVGERLEKEVLVDSDSNDGADGEVADDAVEEAKSCVDKGEDRTHESFVGSEIDWKAEADLTGGPSTPEAASAP